MRSYKNGNDRGRAGSTQRIAEGYSREDEDQEEEEEEEATEEKKVPANVRARTITSDNEIARPLPMLSALRNDNERRHEKITTITKKFCIDKTSYRVQGGYTYNRG